MALVVESTSTVSANDASSLTITKPLGVAVGDLLLLIANGNNLSTYPTCTGFTQILTSSADGNEDTCLALLYRIADASDVSASNYTVDVTGTDNQGAAAMLRVSGWVSGNPLFASSASSTVIDSASYSIGQSGLSITRPGQQLLIIAGNHKSDDDYADYSGYSITSSDSNPTWTVLANNVDYTTASGAKENTFFVAYAVSTDTSTITAYSADVASSITGGIDSDAYFFAVFVAPIDATGTNALLSVSPTVFDNAGVDVGGNGTNALLEVEPEFFNQSGSGTTRTAWVNESKPTTSWNNETL